MPAYRTRPFSTDRMPPGIPFIVGNEAAERFSFYGMRAILVVFMTGHLMGGDGQLDVMAEAEARGWYHLFVSAVYLTPLFGAIISDVWLGKYRTIILLSLLYCAGHFVLALDDTRWGLAFGLGLIALGAGGIKPCVSAHVGDQFGQRNGDLISRAFGWFYMAINLGAFISTLLTPWLLKQHGAAWAFGIPGVLMVLATLIFWAGRWRFAHAPPAGKAVLQDLTSPGALALFGRLALVYVFIAVFWSLFDQTGSSWVQQAQKMDNHLLGYEILPAQIQAANPLLILILVPLFGYWVYPWLGRRMNLTATRKISLGFFVAAAAFGVSSLTQWWLDQGQTVSIVWQLLAYVVLTTAEVMVSITGLEYAYTQAPARLKSFVMAFFMLSITLGNLFTSAVNFLIQGDDGKVLLAGANYFLFFTALMLVTAVVFAVVAPRLKEQRVLQDEGTESP